jgi:glycosyltransferase involved in cell wall biosynthesis
MAELPGVDVVIATRGRPDLLREALEAVWSQTYPGEVRVTVVFDQSAPDHGLARSAGNRSITVVGNSRTPGLAGGRNTGIAAGRLPLVAFCDDDDVWLPAKLEREVEALLSAGAETAVTGILVEYDDATVPRVPRPEEMQLAHLVRRRVMAAHPSTVLVRRAALTDRIGWIDEAIPGSYGEDFDWIIRAAQAGPIAVVPEPLVRVRWGQSQFSQQWDVIVAAIDYGLAKHPAFHADRHALGRLYGRRSFALAASGSRDVWQSIAHTLRVAPFEPRLWLAAIVALRITSAERVMDLAHRRGHGI